MVKIEITGDTPLEALASLTAVSYTHLPYRGIAQQVEHRSPKPRAEGSIPSAPAKKEYQMSFCFICLKWLGSSVG